MHCIPLGINPVTITRNHRAYSRLCTCSCGVILIGNCQLYGVCCVCRVLPSGKLVRISTGEMAAMKAIFDLFDCDGTGSINARELQALHVKLGEPITDLEAKEAVEDIAGGNDAIDFEHFCLYWDGTHPSQRTAPADEAKSTEFGVATKNPEERVRKRQWYQARFKFVKAKVSNPAVGRIYTKAFGAYPSLEYRVRFFFDDDAGPVEISPWHDVPYKNPDNTYNMIVEIPKWSRRKFEIATGEVFNPIKQDVKNGVLREYNYGDMLFNYGAIVSLHCVDNVSYDPIIVELCSHKRGKIQVLCTPIQKQLAIMTLSMSWILAPRCGVLEALLQ
jgi:hypothetical protein